MHSNHLSFISLFAEKSCSDPVFLFEILNISDWLVRKVGQVVLVVIDALRADFVLPDGKMAKVVKNGQKRPKMKRLHDLIIKGEDQKTMVKAFVAKANSPTVTMPRIKVRF